MANDDLLQQVWNALWDESQRYFLPRVVQHGARAHQRRLVAPLPMLPMPDTGMLSLGRLPQETVYGLELFNSQVVAVGSIARAGALTLTADRTAFTAALVLGDVRFVGHYRIATRPAPAPFNLLAAEVTPDTGGSADAGDTDDPNIQLARQQRARLLQSDSGRQLVAMYNDNNDTYNELFQRSPQLQQTWKNYTTGGGNTQFFMQHTATALQPENIGTMLVNRTSLDPPEGLHSNGTTGASPSSYDQHAYYMQTYIMTLCYRVADYYTQHDDHATAARYKKAGDDAGNFSNQTQQHTNPISQNDPQPVYRFYTGEQIHQLVAAPTMAQAPVPEPLQEAPYLEEIRQKVAADLQGFDPAEIFAQPLNTWQTALLGKYTGQARQVHLRLSGTLHAGPPPRAAIVAVTGTASPIGLTLEAQTDPLFDEVQAQLQHVGFVTQVLQSLLLHAMNAEGMRLYIAGVLNAALAESAGNPAG